jgi:hypothetical protein
MQAQAKRHPMGFMIDTLQYAKELERAGVSRKAAEIQAEALAHALDSATQTQLATKADIHSLEVRLTHLIWKVNIGSVSVLASLMGILAALMTFLHFH